MLYNDNVCSLDEVDATLQRSSTFGWSWSKEKREPYRHTAIVLYFDKIQSFSINFRPGEGFNKYEAAFSECTSVVTIEWIKNPNDRTVTYFELFEEFTLDSEASKTLAMETINLILSYEPGRYNLVANNCRKFVDGVKEHVTRHRKDLNVGSYHNDMAGVKNGDVYRYLGAAVSTFTAVGGLVVGAAAIVTAVFGNKGEEEDREKIKTRSVP